MATDFIDKLRNATFPTARRGGYETAAVDSYLRELAEWLETGGDDQTRAALVQRDMERVGERTGTILSAAQESADRITAEARTEAEEVRADAEREAADSRASADAYSTEARTAADEHVRISAEAATREAADLKVKADSEAQEKIGEADSRLQRATEQAAARTAGVEQEIAELLRARDAIVANLEELAGGIRGVAEGPGSAELDVPAGLDVASAQPGEATQPYEPPFDPQTVGEHPVVASTAAEPGPPEDTDERPADGDDAEETEPLEQDDEADSGSTDEEATRMIEADYDTDEQERARERELQRRRNPQSKTDPHAEDSDVTGLL